MPGVLYVPISCSPLLVRPRDDDRILEEGKVANMQDYASSQDNLSCSSSPVAATGGSDGPDVGGRVAAAVLCRAG